MNFAEWIKSDAGIEDRSHGALTGIADPAKTMRAQLRRVIQIHGDYFSNRSDCAPIARHKVFVLSQGASGSENPIDQFLCRMPTVRGDEYISVASSFC